MANKKVSELPVVSTIDDNDIFVLDHDGSTGTVTTSVLASYISGGSIPKPTGLGVGNNGNVLTYQHSTTSWIASAANFIKNPTTTSADNGKVLTYQHSTTSWIASAASGSSSSITSGTAVTLTDQRYVDFTGIPSWAKRVTVMYDGITQTGDSDYIKILFGTSQGFETTGYISSNGSNGSLIGFLLVSAPGTYNLAHLAYGTMVFTKLTGNTWIQNGCSRITSMGGLQSVCGSKTLASTLTQIRITTEFTDRSSFRNGTVNILWE